MPNLRTMVTELGTALGMLGYNDIDQAVSGRSPAMRSLSPEDWDRLRAVRNGGAFNADFHAAWANGQAFLTARDGLRGRLPEVVEWKGAIRAAGDEVAPVDLRIDHVYLVSCKYLSNILFNVSPTHIFDNVLVGGTGRRGRGAGEDWYAEVAPTQYQQLYEEVRQALAHEDAVDGTMAHAPAGTPRRSSGIRSPTLPGLEMARKIDGQSLPVGAHAAVALHDLPARAGDLTTGQRSALSDRLKAGWPGHSKEAYRVLSDEVARQSAGRWHRALSTGSGAGEAMLWRLLRMGSAPYFVLGSSATQSLRLRIATPWDWRQQWALLQLDVFAQDGGQPRVGWQASVRDRVSGDIVNVAGHVEVRWSHGRFGGLPEAKGYLDTAHHLVPGYIPLRMNSFHLTTFDAPLHVPELAVGPLLLRPFTLADLPMVKAASADPYIPSITSIPARYSDDEGRAFVERQHDRAADGHGYPFVITRSADPSAGMGAIGLWLREIDSGRASIGYWLLPAWRGQHLATTALQGVVRFAFDILAIPRLQLFVEPWNVASQRTAEAAGFDQEALLRGWERIDDAQHDAYAYVLLRHEGISPQDAP